MTETKDETAPMRDPYDFSKFETLCFMHFQRGYLIDVQLSGPSVVVNVAASTKREVERQAFVEIVAPGSLLSAGNTFDDGNRVSDECDTFDEAAENCIKWAFEKWPALAQPPEEKPESVADALNTIEQN